jgi:two-component system cell cycle response regulator DivK
MRKTVLVVEDNDMNLRLTVDLLDYHGYQVLQAHDGLQALIMAREHLPDLILMDMQMPVMNGYDATRALRADPATAKLRIIAMTSFVMEEEKTRIFLTGVDDYISKPIDTRKFPERIRRALEG